MRRQAQREARSAESWNTWKRNIRNNSLNAPSRNDLEQQAVGGGKNRLRSVQTEPRKRDYRYRYQHSKRRRCHRSRQL
ncbi:Bgt-487 [Blumeria graminis f. sp. tritici]|uniref:Bgt-487 n=2 Tax=Blumeria graminis f. sp. tritici TaxID=62690 RepID=A0A381L465_BLUGR|nr:Vacuolar H+/Ca2+ exchanger [Blumeria graminis f. sp. tritici 96224]VDB92697.1 Bgt-487 [Blumeria graminis f. sp. tritici]